MAKKGMKRIDRTHTKPKNDVAPVPEIQGRAKSGKVHANPIIPNTEAPSQKVYHNGSQKRNPIPRTYSVIDNDLAHENLVNDISAADLQDL